MTRLGVAMTGDRVVVAAVCRDRLVWSAARSIPAGEDPWDALVGVLTDAPPGRVQLALGSRWCQARLIENWPRMSERQIRQAVAVEADRWFLRSSSPLVTSGWKHGDAVAAIAVSADVMDTAANVLARGGRLLAGISSVGFAGATHMADGAVSLDGWNVAVRQGHVITLRRNLAPAEVPQTEQDPLLAAARGVARATHHLIQAPDDARNGRGRARRVATALGMTAVAPWLVAGALGLARLAEVSGEREQLVMQAQAALEPLLAAEQAFRERVQLMMLLRASAAERSTDRVLLSRLAVALPPGSEVVTLHRDAAGVARLTVTGPVGAGVVGLMQQVAGVDSVRLDGPITSAGNGRDRLTVVFRWAGS